MTETRDRMRAVAIWVFVSVGIIQAIQALVDALPNHAFDASWPEHARFHVTIGAANQAGFAVTAIIIALIPFRRGERWSWWALLCFALLSTVAIIPSAVWHGSGPPPGAWILIGACIIAMFGALATTAPRTSLLSTVVQEDSGRAPEI